MSESEKTLIEDVGLALDAAYAQKPFFEIALTARTVGKLGIAEDIDAMGSREVYRIEGIARDEGRRSRRRAQEIALKRLFDEVEEDILTRTDFKIGDPKDGVEAWDRLPSLLENTPDLPLRIVEYYDKEWVLVGDVAAASTVVGDPIIAPILQDLAKALEAGRQ